MPDRHKIGKSNVARSKAHERHVARWLTEWSGVEFRRRRVTGRDHATTVVDGTADVICTRPDFKYAVECKCGAGFSLDAALASPGTSKFGRWWQQAEEDARISGKRPMLFFRPAPMQNWIALNPLRHRNARPVDGPNIIRLDIEGNRDLVLLRVEDFLKFTRPDDYFSGELAC